MDIAATQDATAAPSPAPQPQPEPTTPDVPKDPAAYKKWRETGEFPKPPKEAKPKEAAESAPAESASAEGSTEPEEKPAPGSEPGEKPQERQQRRTGAAERLDEILADLKRAGLSPAELKTYKREAQQQAKLPEPTAKPPEPPAPPKRPDLAEHKTWDELRAADFDYLDAHTKEIVQQAILADRLQQAQEAANRAAAEKLAEASKRYGADAEPTIRSTAQAIFGSQEVDGVFKRMVNDSPVIADLLYVAGSKSEDLNELLDLAKTNPGQAIRKLVVLEQLVQEELRKQQPSNGNGAEPQRDESGKFARSAPPASKRVSEAPPPATEVGGKSTPPKDAAMAAFDRGDTRAYMREMNRREIAARKGQ